VRCLPPQYERKTDHEHSAAQPQGALMVIKEQANGTKAKGGRRCKHSIAEGAAKAQPQRGSLTELQRALDDQ
jgi:hypothetical protein